MPYEKPEVRDAKDRLRKNMKAFYFSNAAVEQCLSSATPSIVTFLDALLRDELIRRDENKRARMVKGAGFPTIKSLEDFDFSDVVFPEDISRKMVADLDSIREKHSLVLYGVCGSGKTMLRSGLA